MNLAISVVIPTLNEAGELRPTIEHLRRIPEVQEIIVADGGSTDGTPGLARALSCRVVESPRGRGTQMRRGAEAASGSVVLLLHADTWLEPEAGHAIAQALDSPGAVAGGCYKDFREPSWLMHGSRARCWLRFRVMRHFAGDQAMFVRREVLEKIGGVPDVPIMEEFELCRLLRRQGRLVLAATTVSTSARRFKKHGPFRLYARMGRVTLQYYCGTPLDELKRIYERE